MKLIEARKVAEALVAHLRSDCTRIEIVGSVRRFSPEVGDIELLVIPNMNPVPHERPQFGKPIPRTYATCLDKTIDEMRKNEDISIYGDGDRYKKIWLNYAGIQFDLFICIPPSHWGVQKVIRTGPKDFSHWCVTNCAYGGALPDGYFVKHQVVWKADEIQKWEIPDDQDKAISMLTPTNHLSMPEEIDFLQFLGLGWIEPKEREARWSK